MHGQECCSCGSLLPPPTPPHLTHLFPGQALKLSGGKRLGTSVNSCGMCGGELKDFSHMGMEVSGSAHHMGMEVSGGAHHMGMEVSGSAHPLPPPTASAVARLAADGTPLGSVSARAHAVSPGATSEGLRGALAL
jgi:hypothetical protein